MERLYEGHDGIVDAGRFHTWIMSARGVKLTYNRVDPNLDRTSIYRFKDATIEYWESGDHKDGAPVSVKVKGDTKQTVEEICGSIENNFSGLQ